MLEERIEDWRSHVARRPSTPAAEVEELEGRLRGHVATLEEAGLAEDEAFLVAVKRLGETDARSREYSQKMWKRLVAPSSGGEGGAAARREAVVAIELAIAAAALFKLPELFGFRLQGDETFYARNFSLFVLPLLAGYFAWKRTLGRAGRLWLALPFLAAAVLANVLPFEEGSHTEELFALHLPIALWLAVGFAHTGGRWRDHEERMGFVRFSGEWFIYYALIALGGGVLTLSTLFIFDAIGVNAGWFVESWMLPCGAVGAVLVAAWLVETKKDVVQNVAPLITRVFTPLFTLLFAVFLVTMVVTRSGINIERNVLIGFDLLLAVVLGLVLYSISARDPEAPPGAFDVLQLVLVVSAVVVDAVALGAIAARIFEYGFSPNKVTALGENVILLANLGGAAVLYARFLKRRVPFASLERWQTAFLPVYAVWAWVVVALFPLLFSFQ